MNEYRFGGFQILPPVVKNLLIINGIFFMAYIVLKKFGIDLNDILGLHYPLSEKFKSYQIITYMFMHGNLGHIFFNMFAVWMFGSAIENFWGPKRFLFFYLFTGIGAAALHYFIFYFELKPAMSAINAYLSDPSSINLENLQVFGVTGNPGVDQILQMKYNLLNQPVIVGASGALFGILIAFGWMFPNTRILLLIPPIPIKAKYFVAGYGILELVSGVSNIAHDNIAHYAHVGGMLFGLILLLFWRVKRLN